MDKKEDYNYHFQKWGCFQKYSIKQLINYIVYVSYILYYLIQYYFQHTFIINSDFIINNSRLKYYVNNNNNHKMKMGYSLTETLKFISYSLMIYAFYLTSGVYHQKILKHEYTLENVGQKHRFQQVVAFCLFPQLYATIVGYLILLFNKCSNDINVPYVPWQKSLLCGLVINFSMFTYNQAVIYASFPAVVMAKSCGLLSVIVVGVCCSRVTDKRLKLGNGKLVIGAVVTVGILLFNFYKVEEKGSSDNAIGWVSGLLLVGSLVGDGFLPDLQAEIKSTFNPGTIGLYYCVNKYTCMVAFSYLLLSTRISYVLTFLINSPQFRTDILFFSLLNGTGQLVIYRMITLFKQHIPAFVIATRKCITVLVNIVYFGHRVQGMQIVGVGMVFAAVMMEVVQNYREKQEIEGERQSFNPIMEGQQQDSLNQHMQTHQIQHK